MKVLKMHSGLISIRTTELNGFELFQVSSFPNIAFSKFTSQPFLDQSVFLLIFFNKPILLWISVCWAAFFGHLFGKISYQSKCNEILKAEPNSLIGRSIRQRLGLPTLEPTDPQGGRLRWMYYTGCWLIGW